MPGANDSSADAKARLAAVAASVANGATNGHDSNGVKETNGNHVDAAADAPAVCDDVDEMMCDLADDDDEGR